MGKRWTEEKVAILKELVRWGYSVGRTVKTGKLPHRTASAIQSKIKHLSNLSDKQC